MQKESALNLENLVPRKHLRFLDCDFKPVSLNGGGSLQFVKEPERFSPTFALHSTLDRDAIPVDDELVDYLAKKLNQCQKEEQDIAELGEKGVPFEQFVLSIGEQRLVVSNYSGQSLSSEQIEELKNWFAVMVGSAREKFDRVHNVVIMPDRGEKTYDGSPRRGEFSTAMLAIKIFPEALKPGEFRTGNVPNLTGTLTHEYFHQYMSISEGTRLSREWSDIGGWGLDFRYPDPGGEVSDKPNYRESEYGRDYSIEEFCDSAVKAVYNRREFKDERKKQFLDNNFINLSGAIETEESSIQKVDEPTYPEFNRDYTFSIVRAE